MGNGKQLVGSVQSLWQYPVKSMQGTEVREATLTGRGLLGDRACGLVDLADGTVASAKNPRKWPGLLDFQAEYVACPRAGAAPGAVRITLPDGPAVVSDQPDVHRRLSEALGRAVELRASAPATPILQQLWPGEAGEIVTEERMPGGTFFDLGPIHVLTTGTLDQLRRLCPGSDFHPRRFRPNIVIATNPALVGFVEQGWLGRTLLLGESIRLRITGPTSRCVMTTLRQPGLTADGHILRAAAQHGGNVGVYGAVIQDGVLRHDDPVWLEMNTAVA